MPTAPDSLLRSIANYCGCLPRALDSLSLLCSALCKLLWMFAEGTRLAVTAQVYANYCGCLPKALGSQSLLRSMQTTVDVCCVTGLDFPTTKASPRYCICTENVMWMFAKVTRLIVQVSANYCGCLPKALLLRSRQTTADVCHGH